MSFIFGVLALLCAILGIGLVLADENLLGAIFEGWNQFVAFIDGTKYPFGKGMVLIGFAVVFGLIALWFTYLRNKKQDQAGSHLTSTCPGSVRGSLFYTSFAISL